MQQVHLHNEKVTKNPNNFCIKSRCTDILPASISKILETNINAAISKRKITHTCGLPQDITLITNEQYDLISNIDVEDVDLEALSTPPKPFWEHMHYVAFSRVTSIAGLYIESINEKNISVSMEVSDYLKNALQNNKLQTNIQFSNKDTLNILLNNSRSFKKHFNAIQYNKLILQQHINIFLE